MQKKFLSLTLVVSFVMLRGLQAADPYVETIRPLVKEFCLGCHSTAKQAGELNLEQFTTTASFNQQPQVLESILEQLANNEMPPKAERQPSAAQKQQLQDWIHATQNALALAQAGDPGPVVLRRLSNREYTYTLRDLTGVDTLNPAREFPADSAAGEGFTNTGAAMVMSPALLTKYLDAAKETAEHAVLLPTGLRFSDSTSRSDWTNESLAKIRLFYSHFTEATGEKVNVDGTGKVRSDGGRIPLAKYLAALQAERSALSNGTQTIPKVAQAHGLSPKYLQLLWQALHEPSASLLLKDLQKRWQANQLTAAAVEPWQQSLWRFTNVGHLGKVGGPKAWLDPLTPLVAQHEFRVKINAPASAEEVTLYLAASDAGDGREQDFALWEKARFTWPGKPDLLLKDVREYVQQVEHQRALAIASTVACLAAAHEMQTSPQPLETATLAKKHQVSVELLTNWLTQLGIGSKRELKLGPLVTKKLENVGNYNFIQGWGGDNAFSILANRSDASVNIPGTMPPNSIAVHPSPKLASVIAWRSPVAGRITITGSVQDAHITCGNGITWAVEVRRNSQTETLARGTSEGNKVIPIGKHEQISVQQGDAITLVIGPGKGEHTCDLTAVNLSIQHENREWDLAKDLVPDILAGNPHADSFGNREVWHFFGEPETSETTTVLAKDSLLARWLNAQADERPRLAQELQQLLQRDLNSIPADSPDRTTHIQLLSWQSPLFANLKPSAVELPQAEKASKYGIDPQRFGRHPEQGEVAPTSLCVQAPALIEVRLPASLVNGSEFVAEGRLHATSGGEGSVQLQVLTAQLAHIEPLQPTAYTAAALAGAWNSSRPGVNYTAPILVQHDGVARQRFEKAFVDFRQLFPAALCYTTIVPVDEVVTLTLFHREDEPLMRLMLDESQQATLNQLWSELHFISQDAFALVDAYEQIWQYSTQDGPNAPQGDKRLEPLREPILRGAEQFKQQLAAAEPQQLQAVLELAARAWRHPLQTSERDELLALYQRLRAKELPHEQAIRSLLTRILVAPDFLYRGEETTAGTKATPINDWELATRLSYFLWSSSPDAELSAVAASGRLRDPEVLVTQMRRMLRNAKIRRLATEFGCQWLHVRDLDSLDEKSERHFPSFVEVRSEMQEEVTRFFIDMFQEDRSLLNLLAADYTFINGALAKHYGVPVTSPDWQRVEGWQARGRGGILGFAGTLAKQSGASRTSPILRGNWVSEVLLGERLPRPPKGVPTLPEEAPEGLTERQLIERHSSDARCAGCHLRIDPFGFALEGFDAIGRARSKDAAGLAIDTRTQLATGEAIIGLPGLRDYLLNQRRNDVLRQFSRKLLGYALGRSVQLSDKPLLDEIIKQLPAHDYQVSTVIELIVRSPQFREVRGRDFLTVE
jgi:hypothetical protein